jgi:hypothetical protein
VPQVQPVEVDSTPGASRASLTLANAEPGAELEDAAVVRLLTAEDATSIAELATWLKTHARTFTPVTQAIREDSGLSPEAAGAVLDALVWRAPTDAEEMLTLTQACLRVIAERITESLGSGTTPGAISDHDDSLVGSAVAIVTVNRRSRHSETAVDCLAQEGPGGALVLARAFDGLRNALKLHIVQQLKPVDVLELGDNVVASLACSVSKLAEELETPKNAVATRFLAELGPVQGMRSAGIGVTEHLEVGDRVFHASWGAGVVSAVNDESATIDFGSAGTRTLLRSLATLRHAV